ncbi:unnamed protein product, partial [Closterium sp. NIES-54]
RAAWSGAAIFDLDYDPILSAMYALSFSAEGDCYRCVPPDPGTAPAQALHTFTLDSSASRCFFRDNTTFTHLPAPVPVRLADPSGGAGRCPFLHCPPVSGGSVRLTISVCRSARVHGRVIIWPRSLVGSGAAPGATSGGAASGGVE